MFAATACGSCDRSMLLYSRKWAKESIPYGAPPAIAFRCQDKRWVDSSVFCEWKHHFISAVKSLQQEELLLILDGHSSHNQSLGAVETPRKHRVVMLRLPSHSPHQMQPLDVTFLKTLSAYIYIHAQYSFQCRFSGHCVNHHLTHAFMLIQRHASDTQGYSHIHDQ
jgi:hypothetical protein